MKKIVICLDGTDNEYGKANSNVVKLYQVIKKIPNEQVAYYDPGVGTSKSTSLSTGIMAKLRVWIDFATGYSIFQNVFESYSYLMENYEQGDEVYLFGFSRGAYTARVLSGFIRSVGLLEKGSQNLIPYAFDIYGKKKKVNGKKRIDFELIAKFKSTYSRPCKIHFMGVWDTVSSVGYFGNWKSYPYTANNKIIKNIRHALAIDERRAFFTQNKLGHKSIKGQSIKEVWFAGVHSDVGGSYPESESGLSKIALQWMLQEANEAGLIIDPEKYNKVVYNVVSPGKRKAKYTKPNALGIMHKSLKHIWWLIEFMPRTALNYSLNSKKTFIPLGRNRTIPEETNIHETVFERMQKTNYKPKNLPKSYTLINESENIVQV